MRTIMALALAANIFFSVGANYLQGAITSQAGTNNLASTASQPMNLPHFDPSVSNGVPLCVHL